MKIEKIRKTLYKKYINELYNIEGLESLNDEKLEELFYNLSNNINMRWIYIYPDSHKTNESKYTIPIGFLVIGEYPECHPDADYYIVDAYIQPEYRRQNIMSEVLLDYIKTYGGKYCLFIASKNNIAKSFWNSIFEKANYQPIDLSSEPISKPDPHFVHYGYGPKS